MSSPLAANIVDAAALADELARFRVVDAARLTEILSEFTNAGPIALAEYLIHRGVLTVFQAERALAGEARMLALGPYRLTDIVGIGTFGSLFTATHTSKPGVFAVRVLPLRSLWRAKQAKQLARTLAAGVNHSAVVPLLEVDSANGYHYLVWPHSDGIRLTDRVAASGPLSPGESAALLGHLASALAACHARQAMHGALTPHSVVILNSGLPFLRELGAGALLAQNMAEDDSLFDTMSSSLAATNALMYAAPELATDPHLLTAAADQYALGAVGYFAVTGLPPYPHPTLDEQLRAKRIGTPPSAAIVNPAVPSELATILERMMSPGPADRFASLEEVERLLASIATVGPTPASEPISAVSLSQLQEARESSGNISWNPSPPEILRPVERDNSEASVTFDLPDPPETVPDALDHKHPDSQVAGSRSARETPPGFAFFTHMETKPDVAPPPDPVPTAASALELRAKPDQTLDTADEGDTSKTNRDPRLSAPVPVLWHTTRSETESSEEDAADPASSHPEDAPQPNSVLWKKVKRNLMFWQASTDVVQVSVFASTATPGQTVSLTVFLHTPDAAASARTLSRAFLRDAELVGTGYLTREIARESELAVHLSVANAGVAKALLKFQWRGQPHRLNFDLHVPWESPEGTSPGLVSIGLNNVRVGKIEFGLSVLPRKA
jgi:serine/threonine protein kinase